MTPQPPISKSLPVQERPWYRQFWPWFIIALPAAAVIAGTITLYLAVSRPDPLVVEDQEYRRLSNELKAQRVVQDTEDSSDRSDSDSD